MSSGDYIEMWHGAIEKRSSLIERRTAHEEEAAKLSHEIEHLDEVIKHLGRLSGVAQEEYKFAGLGITDAIRRVLEDSTVAMSAMEVHRALTDNGLNMAKYSAPMASIYKILSRLADDESTPVYRIREEGSTSVSYEWREPVEISDDDIPF